jgi:hypothetical protein
MKLVVYSRHIGFRLELSVKKRERSSYELPANAAFSVISAKAGIQNRLQILDSGSRFACRE